MAKRNIAFKYRILHYRHTQCFLPNSVGVWEKLKAANTRKKKNEFILIIYIKKSKLGIVLYFLEKIAFELLYPIYLIKFRKEKKYIAERLKKANLSISPKDVYKNLFFNGLDSLRFLLNKKVNLKYENQHLAQNEINRSNPIVFASIHLGAFEMLHRVVGGTVIVSEFKNKRLDKFLTKIRTTENVKIAKDYEVSKILKNTIRNKEILAVMTDQAKQGREYFQILGDEVPLFFKLPILANRLGASLVFFRTFRKEKFHVIRFERVYAPHSEIDKSEIAKMIEGWILEYPKQWAWNYD